MFLIFITDIPCLLVILQIIIALSHSNTSLISLNQIHRTVHIISTDIEAKIRINSFLLNFGDVRINFTFILEGVDRFQFSFNWSNPFLIQFHAIHGDIVKITHFLSGTARCVVFLCSQFGD